MEDLAGIYYADLYKSEKPGVYLCKFLWEVCERTPANSDIPVISKLVKIYGRRDVFFAILELSDVQNIDKNDYKGLLVYILKRNLLNRYKDDSGNAYLDLSPEIEKRKRTIQKIKKNLAKVDADGDIDVMNGIDKYGSLSDDLSDDVYMRDPDEGSR